MAVAGCVAQAEGEEIVARAARGRSGGGAAILSPPAGDDRARSRAPGGHALETDFPALEKFDSLPRAAAPAASAPFSPCRKAATSSAPSAWCLTRAAPNIRAPPQAILREARQLADKGAREIVLLGQNVNAYRGTAGRQAGAWRGCAMRWPRSKASRASATPPAIRATWATI